MQPKWLNDGEPDENGEYVAVIENNAGQRISTFKGTSYREVADKLLHSQANANREISRLRRPDRAVAPAQMTVQDKPISPGDRLRLATELSDPNRVVEAVTEIVTSAAGGVAPRAVAQNLADMSEQQLRDYYLAEAEAFKAACPDYYPVQQNQTKIFEVLQRNQWDVTRNNLGIVFQTLQEQGEMIPWPEETEPAAEPPAAPNGKMSATQSAPGPNPPSPTSRPRSISTGIRSTDASAFPPPPKAPPKLTRADIDKMPRREYEEKLRDPAFRKAVDNLA
jgi:hypothetical protein